MSKWIVDIHGDIEGDYEIIEEYKEPKKGHWIYSKETARFKEHWTCSCCKHDIIENPKFKNWITGESLDFIFCPMCGAKMAESEEVKCKS